MKKAIISIIVILVLGGVGVLGWGYINAQTDKAYAENAKKLINDFENKYSDDYIEKQFNFDSAKSTEKDLEEAKKLIEDAKKDAQNALNSLASKKPTKRVEGIKKDSEEYFNLTIKAIDNALAYLSYSETLIDVAGSLEFFSGSGDSLIDAIAQFETAKEKIDEAIKDLKDTTPPAGMEDFHKDLISALENMSETIGKTSAALAAGDLTALETYSYELLDSMTNFTSLDTPTSDEITSKILSEEEQNKLDSLPDKINTAADEVIKKKIAF